MKKTLYMVILVITILIGTTLNNFTYAKGSIGGAIGGAIGGVIDGEQSSSPQESSTDGIVSGADDFITKGEENSGKYITKDELEALNDSVYTILVIVGVVIAVIVGAVLAIKFITEGAEGKAEVQKALIAYVIGCVVIFGAFTIWKIIVTVLQGI